MSEARNHLANVGQDTREIAHSFETPQQMLEFFRKKNGVSKLAQIEDKRDIVPSDIYVDSSVSKIIHKFKAPKYTVSTGRKIGAATFVQPESAEAPATIVPMKLISSERKEQLVNEYHHTSAGAKLLAMNVESALPKGTATSATVALVDTAAKNDENFFVVGGIVSLGAPYSTLLVAPEWSLPLNENFLKRPAYLVHTADDNYLAGTDLATVSWDAVVESSSNACPFLRKSQKWDKVVSRLAGPAVLHHDVLQTLEREPQKFKPLTCKIQAPPPPSKLLHGPAGFRSSSMRVNSLNFINLQIDQPPNNTRASTSFDPRGKIAGVGEGPEIIRFASKAFDNIFSSGSDEVEDAACDTSIETTVSGLYGDTAFIQNPRSFQAIDEAKVVGTPLVTVDFTFNLTDITPGKPLWSFNIVDAFLTADNFTQMIMRQLCTARFSLRVDLSISCGRATAFGILLAYDEALDTTPLDTSFSKMRGLPGTLALAQEDRVSLVVQPGFYGNTYPLQQDYRRFGRFVLYATTAPNESTNLPSEYHGNATIYIDSIDRVTYGLGEQPCTMVHRQIPAHQLYKAEEITLAKRAVLKTFPLDLFGANEYASNYSAILKQCVAYKATLVVDWIMPASFVVTGNYFVFATYGDEHLPDAPKFNRLRMLGFPMYDIALVRKGRLVIPMVSWSGAYTRASYPRLHVLLPSGFGGQNAEKVNFQIQIKDLLNFQGLGGFCTMPKTPVAGFFLGEANQSLVSSRLTPFYYPWISTNGTGGGDAFYIPITPYNLFGRGWDANGRLKTVVTGSVDNFLHDFACSKLYWRGSLDVEITANYVNIDGKVKPWTIGLTPAAITPIGRQSIGLNVLNMSQMKTGEYVTRFVIPHMSPYNWLETMPPEGTGYASRLHFATNGTLVLKFEPGINWFSVSIRPGEDFQFMRHRRTKIN
uniref:Polyprotein n=1 Tax=Arracacha virus B TaxID=257463 RepID=A0A4Y5R1M1_9SECO|nr:polyprotein [Arracacha virus B]